MQIYKVGGCVRDRLLREQGVNAPTGDIDWVVTGEQLEEIYNDVSGSKVMLRRKDTPHGEMLYAANGYVTAWFMYWLQADREAGKAFWGDAPEIAANPLYQDPKIRLAE